MDDLKDSIVESIKSLLLPEIRKLQDGLNEVKIRQNSLEKQLTIMNENILSNSRRIDEINKRLGRVDKAASGFPVAAKPLTEPDKRISHTSGSSVNRSGCLRALKRFWSLFRNTFLADSHYPIWLRVH